jgi:hypothetical protein
MQVAGKWEEDKKDICWEYELMLRIGAIVGPITSCQQLSMRVFYGSSLFVGRSQIHNPNKAKKYEIKRVIKFEFEQFHSKEGAEHMVYAAHHLFKITHRSRYIQPRPLCPSTAPSVWAICPARWPWPSHQPPNITMPGQLNGVLAGDAFEHPHRPRRDEKRHDHDQDHQLWPCSRTRAHHPPI